MNYYERHIGDYLKDTAHLSLLEHGVYTRLLDVYYTREAGIPDADVARLIGARTRDEKAALKAVLGEFFSLQEGLHTQPRSDREIQRYQGKRAKAQASAQARWGTPAESSDGNANASPAYVATKMRTHSEGNATHGRAPTRSQSPDTRPNTQEQGRAAAVPPPHARVPAADEPPPEAAGAQPTAAGTVCRAMRKAGLADTNPGDPRLLALLDQGATEVEFAGLAVEAVTKRKGWAWVLSVLQARRAEAAAITLAPPAPPPSATVPSRQADSTAEYLRERATPLTPEEKAQADEARKAAMDRLGRTTRSNA